MYSRFLGSICRTLFRTPLARVIPNNKGGRKVFNSKSHGCLSISFERPLIISEGESATFSREEREEERESGPG